MLLHCFYCFGSLNDVAGESLACFIVAGGQFGDEAKGKTVAYLAHRDKPKIVVRAGVGPNASHTVIWRDKKFKLRQVPCGFVQEGARLLIGPGVLINPGVVLGEIEETGVNKRLGIDGLCTVIEPHHIERSRTPEHLKIGSTGSGCGAANAERVLRVAKLVRDIPQLQPFLADVPAEVNAALNREELVIVEGSQAFGLSLIHGTYPYVTCKDTTASTLAADVGIGPTKVDEVILALKAYVCRIQPGPLPTEIPPKKAEELGIAEYGYSTLVKRIGTFDFELAKRSVMINAATQLALTCVDRLFKGCSGTRSLEQLTLEARAFVRKVEDELGVPVTLISTGPGIEEMIDLRVPK